MTKPRKHRFVTQCLNAGETVLTVWPSPEEVVSESSKAKFLESVDKIGNDPRVVKVENSSKYEHGVVFTIDKNAK